MTPTQAEIEDMTASWLEAVANGEAEGFSRTFVPDILSAFRQVIERAEKAEAENAELKHLLYPAPCGGCPGCPNDCPSEIDVQWGRAEKAEQERDALDAEIKALKQRIQKMEAHENGK